MKIQNQLHINIVILLQDTRYKDSNKRITEQIIKYLLPSFNFAQNDLKSSERKEIL